MTWPAGVELCKITWGRGVDVMGEGVVASLELSAISPDTKWLLWDATGDPFLTGEASRPFYRAKTSDADFTGNTLVPVVNQAGWKDESGANYAEWTYRAKIRYQKENNSIEIVRYFAPVVGQSEIDLDSLPSAVSPGTPVTSITPPVTSVAGMTGNISIEALSSIIVGVNGVVDMLAAGAVADGVGNDLVVFQTAKVAAGAKGAVRYRARPGAAGTVYYHPGVTPNMKGTRIIVDPGVKLLFQQPAGDVEEWGLQTPALIQSVHHGWTRTQPATPDPESLDASAWAQANESQEDATFIREDLTTWAPFSASVAGGVLVYTTPEHATQNANKVEWPNATTSTVQGVKRPLELNKYYEASIGENGGYAGKNYGPLFINAARKYAWFRGAGNRGNVTVTHSATSGMLISPTDGTIFNLPNGSSYKHLRLARYGFLFETPRRAQVFINELYVSTIIFNYDVVEVGWMSSSLTWNKFVIKDAISSTNWSPAISGPITVSTIGDSQTDGAYASLNWTHLLPQAVAGLEGGGLLKVRQNLAVSGSSLGGWATGGVHDINLKDFTGDKYVLVMLGTNDVQNGSGGEFGPDAGIALTEQYLDQIANKIVNDGAIPIFGNFASFTDPSVTGIANATQRYDNTGEIRGVLQRFCAENGYELALVNSRMSANLDYWIDNAHPDHRGAALIARAFAQAIARHRRKAQGKTLGSTRGLVEIVNEIHHELEGRLSEAGLSAVIAEGASSRQLVWKRHRGQPLVQFLGDSYTEQSGARTLGESLLPGGVISYAWTALDTAFDFVNRGIGGQRSDQILARVDPAYALDDQDYTHILAGRNDISQGIATAVTLANVKTMVDKSLARNQIVFLGTPHACNEAYYTARPGSMALEVALLAGIRALATATPGVILVDYAADFNGTDGYGPASRLSDGIHSSRAGAMVEGRTLARALKSLVNTRGDWREAAFDDTRNLLSNPLWAKPDWPTAGPPTGWATSGSSGAWSNGLLTQMDGSWLSYTSSPTATVLMQTRTLADVGLVAGDSVWAAIEAQVRPNSANFNAQMLRIQTSADGTTFTDLVSCVAGAGATVEIAWARNYALRTPPAVIPAGATHVRFTVQFWGANVRWRFPVLSK